MFDRAVQVNAKSLIILMTPPLAVLASILFYRRRRPFVTHVVFAIHFYAFWLVVFCVLVPAAALAIVAFMALVGVRLPNSVQDAIASYILIASAAGYLFVAVGRVYEARGAWRLLQVILLALAAGLTGIAYRFVVFLITLYTTSGH